MLTKQGFDLWADDYDQTVMLSEKTNTYPFAGYRKILNTIFNEVMKKENSYVLDIGFGTGFLASKLYEHEHQIDGLDFSSKMIAIAQPKMPKANLMEWDILHGLPEGILSKKYNSIISTYTLHHLTDEEKVTFIRCLLPLLTDNGKLFIGDIAFETCEQHEKCREENNGHWDHDEFYFVYEELKSSLETVCHCEFHPMSHCGGVFVLSK